MNKKDLDGRWYIKEQLNFDKKLAYYRYEAIKKFIRAPYGLELGSANGVMTRYLINDFEQLTSVDASKELLETIPYYKNHIKIHSFFEDLKLDKKFNTVILEHILEHVDNPVDIMRRAKNWLEDDGVMILGVPNAQSIHRLVAVKMGLLKSPDELNDRDYQVGHQRVYSMQTFLADIEEAGLKVIEKGGVFFKPLSNGQIENNWDEKMIEGFYELGKDFPEFAAEIFVVCQK